MTIRYTLTRADLIRVNFRALLRNRFLQVLWGALIAWDCYTTLTGPQLADTGMVYKIVFTGFMAVFYYALLFSITFVLTSALLLVRKNKGVLGEHRLTVTEDGLFESTVHNESLNRWSAYHKTVKTARYLMLYVTETNLHIIPRKRPLLEGDLVAFEIALLEKTGKA